jgi:hypothetical protein
MCLALVEAKPANSRSTAVVIKVDHFFARASLRRHSCSCAVHAVSGIDLVRSSCCNSCSQLMRCRELVTLGRLDQHSPRRAIPGFVTPPWRPEPVGSAKRVISPSSARNVAEKT